jgi:hypothetical protein
MKKILFVILFFIHAGFSQQEPELLPKLKQSFVAFEYEKTIILADSILQSGDSLSQDDLVEVLRMQAIALFSIDNLEQAENSFLGILEIVPNFTLDESETSPKIIAFFDKIKLDYLSQRINHETTENTDNKNDIVRMRESLANYKKGMFRSLILPGWGHYYIGENGKGLALNFGAILTLAPGIFYTIQTDKYEKEYLNTTHEGKIESRYRRYNSAYKNRNTFLAAFAAIWIYSQYDYFFTDHDTVSSNFLMFIEYNPQTSSPKVQFQLHF